jgi:hypothetical protein
MPTSPLRNGAGVIHIPGLPRLTGDRLASPPVVRWLAITPAGDIEVHESENRIGYDLKDWQTVQWRMILDIRDRIDPGKRRADGDLYAYWRAADYDPLGGFFVEPWMPSHTSQRLNPVGAHLMAIADGWRTNRPVRTWGTVLFLSYANDRGIHGSVTDDQVAALHALAAQGRDVGPVNRTLTAAC